MDPVEALEAWVLVWTHVTGMDMLRDRVGGNWDGHVQLCVVCGMVGILFGRVWPCSAHCVEGAAAEGYSH